MKAQSTRLAAVLTAIFACVAIPATDAAGPLQYRLSPGKTLAYQTTQTSQVASADSPTSTIKQTVDTTWRVAGVRDDIATIEQTISRVRIELRIPLPDGEQVLAADTNDPVHQADASSRPFLEVMQPLIGAVITTRIAPTGEYLEVQVPQELIQKLQQGAQNSLFNEQTLTEMISKNSIRVPAAQARVGTRWQSQTGSESPVGAITSETQYVLTEYDRRGRAVIEFDTQLALRPDQAAVQQVTVKTRASGGTAVFDPRRGTHLSIRRNQTLDTSYRQGEETVTVTTKTTSETRLLEQ